MQADSFDKNPCKSQPAGELQDVDFPLLSKTPIVMPLDFSELSFDTCPNPSIKSGSSRADVRLDFLELVHETSGQSFTDFSNSFLATALDGTVTLKSGNIESWPAGTYMLRYKSGLVNENESETGERAIKTVSITLNTNCEIILPTLEVENYHLLDGSSSFSYQVGKPEMQVKFQGGSATC